MGVLRLGLRGSHTPSHPAVWRDLQLQPTPLAVLQLAPLLIFCGPSMLAMGLLPPAAGLINNVVLLPRVTPDTGGGTVILAEMGTNVLVRCAWPCALPPLPCPTAPGHGNFCVQPLAPCKHAATGWGAALSWPLAHTLRA